MPIKRKWFDLIVSGEKQEEYREIKRYWVARLTNSSSLDFFEAEGSVPITNINGREYVDQKEGKDTITFHVGYSKNAPTAVVKINHIEIKKPNPEWCPANTSGYWFSINLGEVISTLNIS